MTQPQFTVFKMTTLYQVAIYLYNGDSGMINLMVVELFFRTDSNLQSTISAASSSVEGDKLEWREKSLLTCLNHLKMVWLCTDYTYVTHCFSKYFLFNKVKLE